ncbi:MAG: hypothetical protein U0470_02110 [Anaerolineae bacterium]
MSFGAQTADVSWARQPDGTGDWSTCVTPSMGRPNGCVGGGTATPSPAAPTATTAPTRTPIIDPTPTRPAPTATRFDDVDPAKRAYLPIGYRRP